MVFEENKNIKTPVAYIDIHANDNLAN